MLKLYINVIIAQFFVVSIVVVFAINIGIGAYFVYSHWCLKKDVTRVRFSTHTQTTI